MKTITVTSSQQINLDQPGEYHVILSTPEAEAEITGVFDAAQSEQKRVTVVIHHQAPHTRANTTLKGVARDQSYISFTGRIIIDPQCGDTNSFLTERVLLLSDQARAETVPDLEIMADDVKCSHAASISHVSEEHLFYLQSRGLNRDQATDLIVSGFLEM